MRNLKRVLSLALALVMVIGMMAMGAGAASADFGDAAEIDYTEAVDVISGLGIMIGDDQGNFNAKDILTREQAAKIICYVMMGADNAEKLGKNTQIFTDVAAGRWSAGYIAYCANLGIIAGYGNGTFGPTDYLTGVQFGKLLLVAAGYNAETQGYLGTDWATNIATDMIANGLDLKGVVLSENLTREQAAQMLLQAMDMKTVTYTTGNVVGMIGPYETGETFADAFFPELEKIEGVITANEYADLYGDTPLKAGKTEIDGVTYKAATDLTAIGMSVIGWANDGTVLYLADSGKNAVYETGAATDIGTTKKFEKVTGLKDGAEYFLNFGGEYTVWTCEYLLTYGIGDKETVVKAGKAIDIDALADVFQDNNGYVYLGTKNTDNEEDYSSTMTWKKFKNTYLESSVDTDAINETENGEWLKVIDNDGDGTADYVFKTEFAMSEITNITKKGVYTLTALGNNNKPSIEVTEIDTDKETIVTSDELAKGDIVIYTQIDGVYYINVAEKVTETIDKKGFDTKNETVTCDGTVYGKSGIGYADIMYSDIMDADSGVSYDFYLDHFGFVRLYTESAYNKGFVLLTDGYYYTNNRTEEYQATIFDAETAEQIDVNVAAGKKDTAANIFINDSDEGWNGSRGTWGRLLPMEWVYFDRQIGVLDLEPQSVTNIAAYTKDEDGVYTLTKVENASNKTEYSVVALDDNELGPDTKLTEKTWKAGEDKIQATNDTVYYLVIRNAKNPEKIDEILTWTGYANAPKDAGLAEDAMGYAVISEGTKTYDIAEIMVFESYATYTKNTYFVFDKNTYTVDAIGYDAEDEIYTEVEVDMDTKANVNKVDAINFYDIYADGSSDLIEGDGYADHFIYTGTVRVAQKVSSRDYVIVTNGAKDTFSFKPANTTSYIVKTNGHDVEEQSDAYAIGQELIIVADKKDNILYVINVSLSVNSKDVVLESVQNLYNKIAEATTDKVIAQKLAYAKTEAKKLLTIDTTDYKAADLAKLPSKADAEKAIDDAKTVAEVAKILEAYEAAVAKVPTAAERDAEAAIVTDAAAIKAGLEGAKLNNQWTEDQLAQAAVCGHGTTYTAKVTNLTFAQDVATYTVTLTHVKYENVTITFDVTAPME